MLFRARRTDAAFKTTDVDVGPGTYDPAADGFKVKNGVAPFNSTVERQTCPLLSDAPGPGSYDPPPEVKSLRPLPQFRSVVPRIPQNEKQDSPGPGSYCPPLVKEASLQSQNKSLHSAQGINWMKVATSPSIPAPGQSFGYVEAPTGELVQQGNPVACHAGIARDSAGPGEYNPNVAPLKPTRLAPSFAKLSGKRHPVVEPEQLLHPGPGAYDPSKAYTSDLLKGGVMTKRPNSMFASTTKRSAMSTHGKDSPGPGSYKPPSGFKGLNEYLAANPESHHAFGSTGKLPHFSKPAEEVPGPGAYTVETKGPASQPSPAFAFKGSRFSDRSLGVAPGPGAYECKETTLAVGIHKRVAGRFGIFGSTSQRFPQPPVAVQAGPASYTPKTVDEVNFVDLRRRDRRTSAFRSKVARSTASAVGPQAATVFYEQPSDWPKPSTTSKAFITTMPRFAGDKQHKEAKPGPGAYDVVPSWQNNVSASIPRGTRFDGKSGNVVPGPGSYNTVPSLIKKTFNITIGDNWE